MSNQTHPSERPHYQLAFTLERLFLLLNAMWKILEGMKPDGPAERDASQDVLTRLVMSAQEIINEVLNELPEEEKAPRLM